MEQVLVRPEDLGWRSDSTKGIDPSPRKVESIEAEDTRSKILTIPEARRKVGTSPSPVWRRTVARNYRRKQREQGVKEVPSGRQGRGGSVGNRSLRRKLKFADAAETEEERNGNVPQDSEKIRAELPLRLKARMKINSGRKVYIVNCFCFALFCFSLHKEDFKNSGFHYNFYKITNTARDFFYRCKEAK